MGHTVKFCREEETTFDDALEEYDSSKKAQEEKAAAQRPTDGQREKRRGATPTVNDIVEQQLQRQPATGTNPVSETTMSQDGEIINLESDQADTSGDQSADEMEIDPKTLKRTANGSLASKHAPLDSSLHMHVDPHPPADDASRSNGEKSDVPPPRRHSMSSTSMSQTPVYHAAHRA